MTSENTPCSTTRWATLGIVIATAGSLVLSGLLGVGPASAQEQTQGQTGEDGEAGEPEVTDEAEVSGENVPGATVLGEGILGQNAVMQNMPEGRPGPQEGLDELGISGYADPWIVEPGQSVEIMASTSSDEFEATVVRVIHGDADPMGPGSKEEVVETSANGEHQGQYQTLPLGSYGEVEDDSALRPTGSFTLTAWIAPTTIPGSELNPMALSTTPVGTPRPQGIITKWSQDSETGYGLVIEENGSLGLWLAGADGQVQRVDTGVALQPWTPGFPSVEADGSTGSPMMANESGWYFVAASYDAETGQVRLYQQSVRDLPNATDATVSETVDVTGLQHSDCPLLMAAYWTGSDAGACGDWPGGLYNGKIDNPRLYDQALSREQIEAIRQNGEAPPAVASWDFSQQISSDEIVDSSTVNGRSDGAVVNNPVRAVTGHDWQAKTMNFNHAPEQYGAIYFHEDDLGNARWEQSLSFEVPDEARSGYYAAKLETDENTYYVPFFVRPQRNTSQADIAYLIPTFTYLAYGNTTSSWMSLYDAHADGSGVVYSSHLRPLTDQRVMTTGPNGEGTPWAYEADTHLSDWLESNDYNVDYITDHTLHKEGAELLDSYDAVLTGTHPEYVSAQMLDALETWLMDGGRLMYLGGNGFYWVTSLSESGDFVELRRHDGSEAWEAAPGEYYHSTTGEYGGLWRFRGRHPQELVGVGFTAQGFFSAAGPGDYGVPYDRVDNGADDRGSWVFEGVSDRTIGDFPSLELPGGPAGQEVDRADYGLGTPANTVVLAKSQQFGDEYLHVVEELPWSNLAQGGSVNPLVRADMTLMYYPNGGAVFSASSMTWTGSLFYNDYENEVSRITANVLDKFASGDPLPGAPEE